MSEVNWDKYAVVNPADKNAVDTTPKKADKQDISELESMIRGAAQGATLGFSDEIAGAGEAAGKVLTGTDSIKDLLDNYAKYRNESRANNQAAEQANPISYKGGEVAGGIGSMFVPGLNVTKGATILSRMGTGAKIGALAGLGGSEATNLSNTAADVAKGAMSGAALVPVAEGLVGAAKIPGNLADYVNSRTGGTIAKGFELGASPESTGVSLKELANQKSKDAAENVYNSIQDTSDKVGKAIGNLTKQADNAGVKGSVDLSNEAASLNNIEADNTPTKYLKSLVDKYKTTVGASDKTPTSPQFSPSEIKIDYKNLMGYISDNKYGDNLPQVREAAVATGAKLKSALDDLIGNRTTTVDGAEFNGTQLNQLYHQSKTLEGLLGFKNDINPTIAKNESAKSILNDLANPTSGNNITQANVGDVINKI